MKPPERGDLIDGPEEGEVMDPGTAAVGLSIASAGFGASSSIMKGAGTQAADEAQAARLERAARCCKVWLAPSRSLVRRSAIQLASARFFKAKNDAHRWPFAIPRRSSGYSGRALRHPTWRYFTAP